MEKKAKFALKWNRTSWVWEWKVCLEQGKEIDPSSLKPGGPLSTPSWEISGWTSSPLLHYFIRLLIHKHMETIHNQALITCSFKGMAGPGYSVKNYFNPSLTSNPPSHFPKFLSHAFQKGWLLFLRHDFVHSVHFSLFFCPGVTWRRMTAELPSRATILTTESRPFCGGPSRSSTMQEPFLQRQS